VARTEILQHATSSPNWNELGNKTHLKELANNKVSTCNWKSLCSEPRTARTQQNCTGNRKNNVQRMIEEHPSTRCSERKRKNTSKTQIWKKRKMEKVTYVVVDLGMIFTPLGGWLLPR